jgi:spermidine synthase
MSESAATPSTAGEPSRILPWLLLLFAGSGASALIYEIVWYQMLQLAIGSTAVSLGVLLATFMGGLSLGSWLLPRYLSGKRAGVHPLKAYGYIEIGIGVLGLALLVLIPIIDKVYVAGPNYGLAGMILRAVFCAVVLLPPTILMGASLPAMARWAESTPRGASWWGFFYGANIAGAVIGSVAAGFYLLRLYDIYVATAVAAAINIGVAVLSLWWASRVPAKVSAETGHEAYPEPPPPADQAPPQMARWGVLLAIALSGAASMGAQVAWARILGPLLGGTVYVFSIILAVFLVGLGLGATAGSAIGRRFNARLALGWCQVLGALGLAWTAYQFTMLPYWPMNPQATTTVMVTMQSDLVRVIWGIFPATLAWGAAVPLAFAAVRGTYDDAGKTVGGVYAANTLGAIVGALGVSLLIIPLIGTHFAERLLVAVSVAAAFAAFVPGVFADKVPVRAWSGLAAAALASVILIPSLKPVPQDLIAYGRRTAAWEGQFSVIHFEEGMNSSIAYTDWDGWTQFHVAGKVEASNMPQDMSLERLLGYVPILMKPEPESVLVVGFGAGVTAGDFVTYPTIERIAICEIEPAIPPASTTYFGVENHNVLNDPRTQIYYDDARHYVLTTDETFDIITTDPIHPFVKGLASLYSLEYFEMLRERLNPGGLVTQWIPLYESDFATVKSEIATFMEAFEYVEIFANTWDGFGYDLVLIGHEEPLILDVAGAEAMLARPEYALMRESMAQVGFYSAQSLLDTYIGDKAGLLTWIEDAQINRDKDLRLQYLAGFALNKDEADNIYREIRTFQRPPVGLRYPTGFSATQQ